MRLTLKAVCGRILSHRNDGLSNARVWLILLYKSLMLVSPSTRIDFKVVILYNYVFQISAIRKNLSNPI